ncbi:MAG: putative photosynthetic complex assembly protein PuhE [Rhodovibrio sp.]|nr:putative photosynthetic complex assembly protein PuhE [Rhodovibrio sp.]
MDAYLWPALFALFLWWFSTGAVIYLDGLPTRTFKWSMLGATVVTIAALFGIGATADDTSLSAAYCAFASGLLAWGWVEISFYTGYVTGPRTHPCPTGCRGWKHFGHAIMTSLWHELAILAGVAIVAAMTWGQPNQIGLWTFVVLWWMHQSAKLNVFLGVRNVTEEFVPEHLTFLRSFLTKRNSMNLLFPVSVTVSTVVCVYLVDAAIAPGASTFEAAGNSFLATLMALAILEHWFLMLPLPAQKLWSWGLKSRPAGQPFEVDVVAGFLGAGKTTYLRHALASVDPDVPTVALINDFGELGIDGSLLSGRGAEVVELPNGCICCSLRQDLAQQLREALATYKPQRILIEPSGVADVASLLGVLDQADIKPLVRALRLTTLVDAGAFLADYARLPEHFETQARLTPLFVVNKIDTVNAGELETVYDTLRALNPAARILPARYGQTTDDSPDAASFALLSGERPARLDGDGNPRHAHPPTDAGAAAEPGPATGPHDGTADGATPDGSSQANTLGLDTWSARLTGPCDPQSLRAVLDAVASGAFGDVARVKGIARAGAGWVHFDVAGGRSSVAAFAPHRDDEPRVVAIGRRVDGDRLKAAFEACRTPVVGTC